MENVLVARLLEDCVAFFSIVILVVLLMVLIRTGAELRGRLVLPVNDVLTKTTISVVVWIQLLVTQSSLALPARVSEPTLIFVKVEAPGHSFDVLLGVVH